MIEELERLARDAADEAQGDWFDPDLVESCVLISSSRKARRFTAAASPDAFLKLLAVVKAAKALTQSIEGRDEFSLEEYLLKDALAELAQPEASA